MFHECVLSCCCYIPLLAGLIVNMATITDHQTNHSTLMVTNTK